MPHTTIITCSQLPAERLGYIENAWRSLQAQTDQDFRWVIVLDQPRNPLPKSISDTRISVVVSDEHIGQATARNIALRGVGTEYVCTLDDDDALTPDSIRVRRDFLDRNPGFGWVAGHMSDMNPDGDVSEKWRQPAATGEYNEGDLLDVWGDPANFFVILTHTFLMRTDLVKRIGGWRHEGAIEDIGVIARLSEISSGAVLEDVLYHYRNHGSQASKAASAERDRIDMSRQVWNRARALSIG